MLNLVEGLGSKDIGTSLSGVKTAATAARRVRDSFARTAKETLCTTTVIDLLKAHEYFRGISDAVLGEIASFGDGHELRTLLRSSTSSTIRSRQSASYSGVG